MKVGRGLITFGIKTAAIRGKTLLGKKKRMKHTEGIKGKMRGKKKGWMCRSVQCDGRLGE